MSDKKNGCRLLFHSDGVVWWECFARTGCDHLVKSKINGRCVHVDRYTHACDSRPAQEAEAKRVHDAIKPWLPVESDADDQRDTLRATPCTYLRWSESRCPGNIEGLVSLTPLAAMVGSDVEGECLPKVEPLTEHHNEVIRDKVIGQLRDGGLIRKIQTPNDQDEYVDDGEEE